MASRMQCLTPYAYTSAALLTVPDSSVSGGMDVICGEGPRKESVSADTVCVDRTVTLQPCGVTRSCGKVAEPHVLQDTVGTGAASLTIAGTLS